MADSHPSQADRTTNLARVRDNQRRSRARRKEYLTDLESKYRHCEQVGVEASAAIQGAARRVAEENRKLRTLLKRKGVSEEEIRRWVEGEEGDALEGMLGVRWECGGAGGCGGNDGEGSLRATATASPAEYQVSPVHSSSAAGEFEMHQQQQAASASPQIAMAGGGGGERMLLPQQQAQQQHAAATTTGANFPSTSASSTTSSGMHTPSSGGGDWNPPSHHHHTGIPNSQPRSTDLLPQQHQQQVPPTSNPTSQPHQQQQPFYPPTAYYYDIPPQHQSLQQQAQSYNYDYDSSSCHDVAGVLRALRPDMGSNDFESELGCGDGRDCSVPNSRAFDLLDRFSERLNAL